MTFPPGRPLSYRTVFISDTHLGSRAARADALARFLKVVRCERLYLVGDIVDMWRLRQRWYWPGDHNNVVRRILDHARHGTDVVFIPGNHDEGARQFLQLKFGGVRVLPQAVHRAMDGRRMLVTHGDQFDLVVRHHRLLSVLGSQAYDALVAGNRHYNRVRRCLGLGEQSMSKAIKLKVKKACTYISDFEAALMREAQRHGLDGVICGHIHQAALRDVSAVAYFNCGDWVEGATAVVEHRDGSWELLDAERAMEGPGAPDDDDRHDPDDDLPLSELIAFDRIFDLDPEPNLTAITVG